MLDFLFGWSKASKCKKLIKRTQCRLKLLKSKQFAVIRVLKADIAQLLENGHEQKAMNKIEQLYIDENRMSMYEMLNTFSEFVLLNLSYIRRHKDIPNDVNEAISTLIFVSARISEVPELRAIRKLFMERYGKRFVAAAVELYPGNLVNSEVKYKLDSRSVPEDVRNKMVDEIVRDYFCKLGPLAIEYKPDIQEQPRKVTESTNYSIVLQTSPSMLSTPTQSKVANFPQLISPPCERKLGRNSSDNFIYPDDVEEFRSPIKQRGQDQRFFVFKIGTQSPKKDDEKQARKRTRRRKTVSKENQSINDPLREIYYSSSPVNRRKCLKKLQAFAGSCEIQCYVDKPCYIYAENSQQNYELQTYERSTTMPQRQEIAATNKDIRRTSSVPVENGLVECSGGTRISSSPKYVHPKLPDCDEITAKFRALKKAHLQSKGTP